MIIMVMMNDDKQWRCNRMINKLMMNNNNNNKNNNNNNNNKKQ